VATAEGEFVLLRINNFQAELIEGGISTLPSLSQDTPASPVPTRTREKRKSFGVWYSLPIRQQLNNRMILPQHEYRNMPAVEQEFHRSRNDSAVHPRNHISLAGNSQKASREIFSGSLKLRWICHSINPVSRRNNDSLSCPILTTDTNWLLVKLYNKATKKAGFENDSFFV
jgi:hypothetical protein